jgi:hypothetical protein
MNEQDIRKFLVDYQWVASRVRDVAVTVAQINKTTYAPPEKCYNGEFTIYTEKFANVYFSYSHTKYKGDIVVAQFFDIGNDDPNEREVLFPVSYLWDEDVISKETAFCEERTRRWQAEQDTKKAEEKRISDEYYEKVDRKNWERLKKIYGDK